MALWRTHLWKTLWFALLRSRKDKRARIVVRSVLVLLGVLAYYVFWFRLAYTQSKEDGVSIWWTAGFYVFIFGTAILARMWMKHSHRRQDEALNFSITGAIPQQPRVDAVSPEARDRLQDRLTITAALLIRAGSERYLSENAVPEGAEVRTRQIHNRVLRDSGLWDKLPADERDLLMLPDGAWPDDQPQRVIEWSEQLRLLRWVLRIDRELAPLAHVPPIDYTLAREVLEGKAVPSQTPLNSWDVRAEQDLAEVYHARALAEIQCRGLAPENARLAAWADAIRAQFQGESQDLPVGAHTVAELDEVQLQYLAALARAREQYAAELVDRLSTPISTARVI